MYLCIRLVDTVDARGTMSKRCKKCEYGDCGDMCRYWRIWKKQVPLKDCSEAFINECKEKKAIQYNAITGTRVLDKELLMIILMKHFPMKPRRCIAGESME